MFKKNLKILGIFFLFLIFLFGLSLFFFVDWVSQREGEIYQPKKAVTIVFKDAEFNGIILREEVKSWIRERVQKISGWMYLEATVHNPKGDMLPDDIDDTIKSYIKEKAL